MNVRFGIYTNKFYIMILLIIRYYMYTNVFIDLIKWRFLIYKSNSVGLKWGNLQNKNNIHGHTIKSTPLTW